MDRIEIKHTIQDGDTLMKIAYQYGISKHNLVSMIGIDDDDFLFKGKVGAFYKYGLRPKQELTLLLSPEQAKKVNEVQLPTEVQQEESKENKSFLIDEYYLNKVKSKCLL